MKKQIFALILALIFAVVICSAVSAANNTWHNETVDNISGGALVVYSAYLDSNANPYIYYDDLRGNFMSVAKSNGAWTNKTENIQGNPFYKDISYNSTGGPHASYININYSLNGIKTVFGTSTLQYASESGGIWTNETVANVDSGTGNIWPFTTLRFDSSNNPHILYFMIQNSTGSLVIIPKYASKLNGAWSIETLNFMGNETGLASLDLDSTGNPHLSYTDSNGNLKYAVKSNGVWTSQAVDSSGNISSKTSLVLDHAGNPHISYIDSNGYLKYAAQSAGVWNTETVSTDPTMESGVSLDSSGNPNLIFISTAPDGSIYNLNYAVKSGGKWNIETVNDSIGESTTCVGGLDSSGNLRLIYTDSNGNLKYALKSGGVWTIETVKSSKGGATSSSIVINNLGNPCISYTDLNGNLKYAIKYNGSWTTETVDNSGNISPKTSLALDSSNNPHIIYIDSNGNLKYAVKSSGVWTKETVGSSADFASLALDSAGNPHIVYDYSYFDSANEIGYCYLKYAVKSGGSWTTETVDNSGNVGEFATLALDSAGNPHIGYAYDYYNSNDGSDYLYLKYAVKSGGSWTTETVDNSGNVDFASITLDSAGNPHIGYAYDYYNSNNDTYSSYLEYASKSNGKWTKETVNTNYTSDISLALDSAGNPHISYIDFPDDSYPYIMYAVKSNGKWNETVISKASDGSDNSLALDSTGNPNISYETNLYGDLMYTAIDTTAPLVDANPSGGTYNNTQTVTLTMNEQGNIFYTLNGTTPTSSSTKYTSPIVITSTKTLKFMAIDISNNKSSVHTEVYNINDTTGPTVSVADPANKSVGVPVNKTIKVTFSEPVKAGNMWIELKSSNGTAVPFTTSISGNILTVTSAKSLVNDTKYILTLHTGSVADLSGNPLALWTDSFLVGPAPTVISVDPANNANVLVNKAIKVTFSEPIKLGNGYIELKTSNGTVISINKSISGSVLTITPVDPLINGTKYTLILHTGSVSDLVGNTLGLYTTSFTADSMPPTVIALNPANGAVSVPVNSAIKVTFSEAIKAGNNNIELKTSDGTAVPFTTSISGNVLTVTPTTPLSKGVKYTLSLHTGCVTDLAGNWLAARGNSFTTSTI